MTAGCLYSTLTAELSDKQSPLRRHLEERFPNNRVLQAEYRKGAGGGVAGPPQNLPGPAASCGDGPAANGSYSPVGTRMVTASANSLAHRPAAEAQDALKICSRSDEIRDSGLSA
ncbi:hypothetical protein D477_003063 [Arthrobacter crystallopoietes BAB-32]|uniref:Uncharacterized protein n=1 Tax=Arthrobacter crystallopoietes BAB-32 TaxID=1246476 RepID=N1UZ14_9MICC|nr:hypothetical protein [Arthrobacter crystallopoietes]EMY35641.1 hypothetical protein D477_003063 [Arthrobacter crystallopoietes BAB-32]